MSSCVAVGGCAAVQFVVADVVLFCSVVCFAVSVSVSVPACLCLHLRLHCSFLLCPVVFNCVVWCGCRSQVAGRRSQVTVHGCLVSVVLQLGCLLC